MEIDTLFGSIKERYEKVTSNPDIPHSEGAEAMMLALVLVTKAAELVGWNVFMKADGEGDDASVGALGIIKEGFSLGSKE